MNLTHLAGMQNVYTYKILLVHTYFIKKMKLFRFQLLIHLTVNSSVFINCGNHTYVCLTLPHVIRNTPIFYTIRKFLFSFKQ